MPWVSLAGLYHLPMPLVIGATAAGFSIVRQLGYEEFGELYVAEHPRLPRQQVLRLIPAETSVDLDYRTRFNQESDLAAALWHPNIAGLTDRGEFEGQLWLSSEYIDGSDAAELLGEGHLDGMPPRMVIEIVSAIADALDYAHDSGVLVASLAGSTRHALRHAESGVDLIVAQGTEAGGHTGQVSTMVLVPEVVDAVAPLPVLAAGGIARGRQIAAALALGAEGVWCGSVWLTTEEAETLPVVKDKFLAASSSDTVRSRSLTGKPARMLRTAWTDEWERADSPDPLGMPLQSALIGDPQVRINRAAAQPDAKARELATYFVGQVVGSLNKVQPTASVVLDMVSEFIDAVGRLDDLVDR